MLEQVPPRPWIHPRDILLAADVRRLCGITTRRTLLRWRATKGFPEPFRVIRQRRGVDLELWDRRDVKAWLKANPSVNE